MFAARDAYAAGLGDLNYSRHNHHNTICAYRVDVRYRGLQFVFVSVYVPTR